MSGADILVVILLAVAVAGSVFLSLRRRKKGKGCCGDCFGCHLCDGEKKDKK